MLISIEKWLYVPSEEFWRSGASLLFTVEFSISGSLLQAIVSILSIARDQHLPPLVNTKLEPMYTEGNC